MKRKYADFRNWERVLEKRFSYRYVDDDTFSGCITMLNIDKVKKPLVVSMGVKSHCIADRGYTWMRFLPEDEKYCLMAMFDENHEIVQWYFDICMGNIMSESDIPYYDDLYLDVVVLPNMEVFWLDEDELQEALDCNDITQAQFNLAYIIAEKITGKVRAGAMPLLENSKRYYKEMLSMEELVAR